MYCDAEYSEERISCQMVYFYVLESLLRAIGPIVPHLAEESYMHHPIFASALKIISNRFNHLCSSEQLAGS